MRKEGSGRGKEMAGASKVAKPIVLSAEAAAMELKLAELRKAMEKERAKRDALMANAGGGSIWRNGSSQGGLKAKGKGPDPGHASGGGSASASTSAGRRPGSGEAASSSGGHHTHSSQSGRGSASGAAPTASGSAAGSSQRSGSARALGRASSGPPVGEPAAMPTVSGSRLTTTKPAAAAGKADILDLQAGGGMSCGTDDGPSLAAGAFNEADSHRSFLEALNEWRKANRGDAATDAAAGGGQGASTSAGHDVGTGGGGGGRPRSAAAVSSSSLEVQTETRPASSRPSSAKPLSYFDKLVINTTSRQAGHMAAGEPPETLRASLSGQSSAVFRPASATRKSTPPAGAAGASPAADGAAAAAPAAAAAAGRKAGAAAKATGAAAPAAAPAGADAAAADGGDQADDKPGDKADPLSILDRLEALERQRQAQSQAEDEEDEGGAISVTTAHGMVLTKGVRLPDEVLLPPSEAS